MAGKKIRGITIELGADFTQVTDAFEKVSKDLSSTESKLRDVNKLLKLDPENVVALSQKQGYLKDAIEQTAQKLIEEKNMFDALPKGKGDQLNKKP